MEGFVNSQEYPFITIGICVKNGSSTIHDTIKSIINQNFPHENMEIIFVDDGSNDNTLAIIKDYSLKMNMRIKGYSCEFTNPSENLSHPS